ncbi:arsenic resistance protein [Clostridium brassicae]|uniref:Bile acid:sodium symporter n=1 Tax=Clostridium brassicae TaxID=2999072 RepID=A0ABT4D841_9CLOT|nr:bile acid:sodium symporter [Clostridium brassicae]MCY6958464.1 bile acid:sodium symporter [Clostridium brassicae]
MKQFWNLIMLMQKKLVISIPIFMILGITVGSIFNVSFLKQLIMPFTFLMVYPMMVTLNIKSLFKQSNNKLQIITQVVNFIIMPLVGYSIAKIFFGDNIYLILGLLLTSLLPTSGMTISWTGMAKGNINEAIKMTVIGLLLGAVLTPIYLKVFLGTSIDIPLTDIFNQIIMVILLPMVAGYITQHFLIKKFGKEKYEKEYKSKFPLLSTLGVVLIVFIAMALKAQALLGNPMLILKVLVPLILLYLFNFIFSTVIARMIFKKEDGIAFIYGTVMRNLSVCLAIAMTAFKEQGTEAVIIISLAYVIQVQSAAWYVKLTDKLFSKRNLKGK